jgi:hypothetical protein
MLDFLSEFKNKKFDVMYFISGKKKDSIDVTQRTYVNFEESVGRSSLGDCYHIVLFREDDSGNLINPDKFEAILIDPLEYISDLISQDWYGIVARKTKNSHELINKAFDKLKVM